MTNLEIACPHCNTKLGVPNSYAGREIKCKKCQKRFRVPKENAGKEKVGGQGAKKESLESTASPPTETVVSNPTPPPVVNEPPPIVPPPIKTEPPEIPPPPVVKPAPSLATKVDASPPTPPSDGRIDSLGQPDPLGEPISQVKKQIETTKPALPAKADDPELFPPGFAPSAKTKPTAENAGPNDAQPKSNKKKDAPAAIVEKSNPSKAVAPSGNPSAEMQPKTNPSETAKSPEKPTGDPKRKPRRSNKKALDAPKSPGPEEFASSSKGRWKTTGKEKSVDTPPKPIPTNDAQVSAPPTNYPPTNVPPTNAPPTNAPPTNAPPTNPVDPTKVVEKVSDMATIIGSEVVEPNLPTNLSGITAAAANQDVHAPVKNPEFTNSEPNDPALNLLLSKLPPKFLDPDQFTNKKNVVRLPNADGGFIELDGDVTKVSFRGTKFDVKNVDSTSTRLMRLVWRMMVFVVCAALLMLAYYLLTWN